MRCANAHLFLPTPHPRGQMHLSLSLCYDIPEPNPTKFVVGFAYTSWAYLEYIYFEPPTPAPIQPTQMTWECRMGQKPSMHGNLQWSAIECMILVLIFL